MMLQPYSSPRWWLIRLNTWVLVTAILLQLISLAQAQVGTTLCACTPITYTFQFNFGLTCDDRTIVEDPPAIPRIGCTTAAVNPFSGETITDFVPTSVSEVTFFEFDQTFQILNRVAIQGNFVDGEVFQYTALTGLEPNLPAESVPRALQVSLVGQNQLGQDILNAFFLGYSNDCQAYPIFSVGQQIGWTSFLDLSATSDIYCPLGVITSAPTEGPSAKPSAAPSLYPSVTPVPSSHSANLDVPTPKPSPYPTVHPAKAPIVPPRPTFTKVRKSMMNMGMMSMGMMDKSMMDNSMMGAMMDKGMMGSMMGSMMDSDTKLRGMGMM